MDRSNRDWQQGQGGYDQGGQYAPQWQQPPQQWDESQRQQWNNHMSNVPPQQFQQAVTQAVQQVPPEQYQSHMQQQPVQNLPQDQVSGLAQTLISTLTGRGVSQQQLAQNTGVQNLNPQQMSPQQVQQLLQYAHQNQPEALGQVASQYQNQPDVLHSILGNKALLAAGAAVGLGLMTGQIKRK